MILIRLNSKDRDNLERQVNNCAPRHSVCSRLAADAGKGEQHECHAFVLDHAAKVHFGGH